MRIALLLLFVPLMAFGQIYDRYNYLEIIKPKDTLIIKKDNIITVENYYNSVYIIVGQKDGDKQVRGSVEVKQSDFSSQFSTVSKMFDYLKKSTTNNYIVNYNYTGSNMDTATYVINSDTVYYKIYTYDGSNVTQSKIVYP